MKQVFQILLVLLSITNQSCSLQTECVAESPNKEICLGFFLKEGVPHYQLDYKGKRIIEASKLGFAFKEHDSLVGDFQIVKTNQDHVNTEWEQPWGEFKTIKNHHNALVVELEEISGEKRKLNLYFKLFDDGLGFRYEFPEQESLNQFVIMDELTEFRFTENHDVWWAPVHSENSFYESIYKKNKISETDTINTPATFELASGPYLAIHEANLTDYASMTLRKSSDTSFEADLVPWSNGDKVYVNAPFKTPWRTIILGDKPGDLATSSITLNLNEPCTIEDTSWIEPSKYIGIWWGMHLEKYTWGQGPKHGATTKNAKEYIDFAARHGFNGVLIEGWNYGWDGKWYEDGSAFDFTKPYPDFDLEEISRYAARNNVRIIGHHETGGDVSNYEAQMENAFKLYHKNAINAVKTGYVNALLDGKEWHDGQFGVRHYRKVIETAAKYKIMINNHEPVKGTGLQRTYPNLMSQEGARGQEYDAWSSDGGNPPHHTATLPFTRMLAGPLDFTPGTFNFDYQTANKARVQTTLSKQLALYVIIFSPQQMASDLPENYEGHEAFSFIKEVPVLWEDTKVLDGKIGEYVVKARKDWNSEEWYLGAITNQDQRTLKVDLSFLDENKTYKAQIYEDGKGANYKTDPYPIKIKSQKVSNTQIMELSLAPGGGTAIRFIPINEDDKQITEINYESN